MRTSDQPEPRPGQEHAASAADPGVEPEVVPLNDAAAVFAALAEGIRGSAVGWSPSALQRLEDGLASRYGAVLGDDRAVKKLIVLASEPAAA